MCRAFVLAPSDGRKASPPSVATSHLRRSAVRLLFRVLREHRLVEHDPTLDVRVAGAFVAAARPLTDDEIALGRSFSAETLGETRRPAAWAFAEATARTSELSAIRVGDLDLDAGRSGLLGARRPRPVGVISASGASSPRSTRSPSSKRATPDVSLRLRRRRERREPTGVVVRSDLRDAAPRRTRRASPTCGRSRSPRGLGAQSSSETGRIEAVARALGMRSLDRAARLIGWDWTTPDTAAMRRRPRRRLRARAGRGDPRATRRSTSSPTSSPTPDRTRVVAAATTRRSCGCSTKR